MRDQIFSNAPDVSCDQRSECSEMGNFFGLQRISFFGVFKFPTRQTRRSAGLDLFSPINFEIFPGDPITVELEFRMVIPEGHFLWITSTSGQAQNGVLVSGGIIDNDFQGEIAVTLNNLTNRVIQYRVGMKIAQAILLPCLITDPVHIPVTEDLPFHTERGIRGQVRKGATTGAHSLSKRYGKSRPPHDNLTPGPALNVIQEDPNSAWDSTREISERTETNGYPDPWFTDPQDYYDRLNSVERQEENPTKLLELPQADSVVSNNSEKDRESIVSKLSELSEATGVRVQAEEKLPQTTKRDKSPVLNLNSLYPNLSDLQ